MGLQYKNEHGDCPITLTVPGSGVRGYLITKCVVACHDSSGHQPITVAHDTVLLFSGWLGSDHGEEIAGNIYTGMGDRYFEWVNAPAFSAKMSVIPKTYDIRNAAGVWIAPGETFQVTGTNCRASVTYLEEI